MAGKYVLDDPGAPAQAEAASGSSRKYVLDDGPTEAPKSILDFGKNLKSAYDWATGPLATTETPEGGQGVPENNFSSLQNLLYSIVPHPGSSQEKVASGVVASMLPVGGPRSVLDLGASMIPKSLSGQVTRLTGAGQARIIGDTLNQAAGADAAAVAGRMEQAAPLLPGSNPTAAEVAESGGISALQRSMSAANPQAYQQRGLEQASARTGALRDIAQDEPALNAALDARRTATEPLYATSDAQIIPDSPELAATLAKVPNSAMARAQALAKMRGEPWGGAGPGEFTGKDLAYIQKSLKAMIDDPRPGIAAHERQALAALSDEIGTHLGAPYQAAEGAYRDFSGPINQMQAGQALFDKLSPALADYGALGQETKNAFAKALRDGGRTVQTATGMKRLDLSDFMTPEQMHTLNAVAQDLGRKANMENLGRGVGSNTWQNAAMDSAATETGMSSAVWSTLRGAIPGARALRELQPAVDRQLRATMAEVLLDPKKAAEMMRTAAGREQLSILERWAPVLTGRPRGAAGALPRAALAHRGSGSTD